MATPARRTSTSVIPPAPRACRRLRFGTAPRIRWSHTFPGATNRGVLDAQGAARYLSLGIDTLYRLVRAGELPHSRIGKSIRFRPEDLEEYIAARITREWTRVDRRGRPRQNATKKPPES